MRACIITISLLISPAIISSVYGYAPYYMTQVRQQTIVLNQPLVLNQTLVLLSSSETCMKHLSLTEHEKSDIAKNRAELLQKFTEVNSDYHSVQITDPDERVRRFARYRKLVVDLFREYDERLCKSIQPDTVSRLLQIKQQYKELAATLDTQSPEAAAYKLSRKQQNLLNELNAQYRAGMLNQKPRDYFHRAEQMVLRNREIETTLLNPQQRELWINQTGEQLSSSDLIDLYVDFNQLNYIYQNKK